MKRAALLIIDMQYGMFMRKQFKCETTLVSDDYSTHTSCVLAALRMIAHHVSIWAAKFACIKPACEIPFP